MGKIGDILSDSAKNTAHAAKHAEDLNEVFQTLLAAVKVEVSHATHR